MAYDLVTRGRKDFRIRIDTLHKAVRDPLEGIVGGNNTVFRSRFRPVSSDPTPVVFTSGSMSSDTYELDAESGTVVFDSPPAMQPSMTYFWSNMTDDQVVGVLFAGFHEMEGRWPRGFKLVDAGGSEVLYPEEADVINVVDSSGNDPTCGDVVFSASAVERQLLLSCARYMHLAMRLDDTAEHMFMFREDRGLTVDKRTIPQNLGLALKNADTQVANALRAAQVEYYDSSGMGTAVLDTHTQDYFTDYEWQTDSRDDDYRTTYAGT